MPNIKSAEKRMRSDARKRGGDAKWIAEPGKSHPGENADAGTDQIGRPVDPSRLPYISDHDIGHHRHDASPPARARRSRADNDGLYTHIRTYEYLL